MKNNLIVLALKSCCFSLLAVAASAEQEASEGQAKYTIDNVVNTFDKSKVEKTKVGYQYRFADKEFVEGKTLKLSVVKPKSATHAPHVHKEDEFFFVLEGTAEFHLNGKTSVGGPMTSFYCPTGRQQGIRNIGA